MCGPQGWHHLPWARRGSRLLGVLCQPCGFSQKHGPFQGTGHSPSASHDACRGAGALSPPGSRSGPPGPWLCPMQQPLWVSQMSLDVSPRAPVLTEATFTQPSCGDCGPQGGILISLSLSLSLSKTVQCLPGAHSDQLGWKTPTASLTCALRVPSVLGHTACRKRPQGEGKAQTQPVTAPYTSVLCQQWASCPNSPESEATKATLWSHILSGHRRTDPRHSPPQAPEAAEVLQSHRPTSQPCPASTPGPRWSSGAVPSRCLPRKSPAAGQ